MYKYMKTRRAAKKTHIQRKHRSQKFATMKKVGPYRIFHQRFPTCSKCSAKQLQGQPVESTFSLLNKIQARYEKASPSFAKNFKKEDSAVKTIINIMFNLGTSVIQII
jgi:hypothetical protein